MPPGIPPGIPPPIPAGKPPGIPPPIPAGKPPGIPPPIPAGKPPGMPPPIPAGKPPGMPPPIPAGNPPGMPPLLLLDEDCSSSAHCPNIARAIPRDLYPLAESGLISKAALASRMAALGFFILIYTLALKVLPWPELLPLEKSHDFPLLLFFSSSCWMSLTPGVTHFLITFFYHMRLRFILSRLVSRRRKLSTNTLDVVAEEGEGRIGENRRVGLALFNELLQLIQLSGVHV
nr:hypothetical protein Iba_scaffold27466CG0010 [Ipomoea batatas]